MDSQHEGSGILASTASHITSKPMPSQNTAVNHIPTKTLLWPVEGGKGPLLALRTSGDVESADAL